MTPPTIIEVEPGDAVLSAGSGRVLLNEKGNLSLLKTSSGGTNKPTTPGLPSEGSYAEGDEGIVHTRIFAIHSDSVTKVYLLKHQLNSTVPSVHIYENKSATNSPGMLIWPGSSNPHSIEVESIDNEHTQVVFPNTGLGFKYWVVISG